jgi:hypothetical protein
MEFPEPPLRLEYIREPLIGFAYGQQCEHPKDGLYLYGPVAGRKRNLVTVGVIGTKEGVGYFKSHLQSITRYIEVEPPKKTEKKDRPHLSDFPGLEETFGIHVDPEALVMRVIDAKSLDEATRQLNHHEAVAQAAELYINEAERHAKNEERNIDIWIMVVPELVFDRCKPESQRRGVALLKGQFGRRQKARVDLPLLANVIDQDAEIIFEDIPDFHRHIKARLLKLGKTSQIFRETTLAPKEFLNRAGYPIRGLQDRTMIAWNIATALYYKTQPEPPWKIAGVRPGVCYIGLVFKVLPNHPQEHACCAAQMFLNDGDGIVFRGANGPWKTGKNEFHLQPKEAGDLIRTVIETFKEKHGSPPRELFLHGRTTFSDQEWKAFVAACPPETTLVGVRIKKTRGETKLFRDGDYPVLRGIALILDKQNAYLWTTGFTPRLATYIGPETPNPINITVLRSSGELPPLKQVLEDILGLTKINYNACNFGDGLPVTVRFADRVGDVLVMGAAKGEERQPFKYYI